MTNEVDISENDLLRTYPGVLQKLLIAILLIKIYFGLQTHM